MVLQVIVSYVQAKFHHCTLKYVSLAVISSLELVGLVLPVVS